jgi:hypothetical protein
MTSVLEGILHVVPGVLEVVAGLLDLGGLAPGPAQPVRARSPGFLTASGQPLSPVGMKS